MLSPTQAAAILPPTFQILTGLTFALLLITAGLVFQARSATVARAS
ncbi:hypothetical protein [Devosia sp.]